jgi:hypothetical protein
MKYVPTLVSDALLVWNVLRSREAYTTFNPCDEYAKLTRRPRANLLPQPICAPYSFHVTHNFQLDCPTEMSWHCCFRLPRSSRDVRPSVKIYYSPAKVLK